MVTIIKKLTGGAYPFYEYACLSTDVKPVSLVPDNSICHEIDTGKHFYCANGAWHELPPRGGGEGDGGSSGGAEKCIVTLTQDAQTEVWTADKTVAEVVAAHAAGKIVECVSPITSNVNLILHHVAIGNPEGMNVVVFNATADDDDDKPMTVVVSGINAGSEDIWDFDTYSLGSGPLVVEITPNEGQTAFVSNKTFGEIQTAYAANRRCVVVFPTQNVQSEVFAVVESPAGITVILPDIASIMSSQGTPFAVYSGESSDYIEIIPG